jgi:hypothetical protein
MSLNGDRGSNKNMTLTICGIFGAFNLNTISNLWTAINILDYDCHVSNVKFFNIYYNKLPVSSETLSCRARLEG